MDESLFISTARRASNDFYLIPLEDSKFRIIFRGHVSALGSVIVYHILSWKAYRPVVQRNVFGGAFR